MINHSAVIRKEKAIMQNITLSSMNDGKNNYEKVFSVIGTKELHTTSPLKINQNVHVPIMQIDSIDANTFIIFY
jgi:hypothetical protein